MAAVASSGPKPQIKQNLADSAIKEIVKLDTFRGKFVPRDFIESISAKQIVQARANPQEFDPKPFIRNFESGVEELLRLKRKVQNKIEDLEDQAAASELARRRKLVEINEAFDDVQTAFEALDSRLGEVGNTAIRIGEQLETIDKQRTRAMEAKDLIQYFLEFNGGGSSRLETLRASGHEGEYKAAIIGKRLNAIAKEVDIPGTESARSNIEKFCEELEKSILEQFDSAYRRGDRDWMHRCAKTLLDFNGGASCVQAYVNQHDFFINRSMVPDEDPEAGASDTDPEKVFLAPDAGLLQLYADIEKTCKEEWEVIFVVFENAVAVMQQFVQRIFAQLVS
ncbi:Exocyst complex component 5 [Borealophlyctis nickersoniae]|nr:Exocyst complex component 5 [Borealophlyctis nickersoniae]